MSPRALYALTNEDLLVVMKRLSPFLQPILPSLGSRARKGPLVIHYNDLVDTEFDV